jgi:CubicO group peptidase (beta-lactamase class C family)
MKLSTAFLLLTLFLSAASSRAQEPAPLAEHPQVAAALKLLDLWIEEQRAGQDLPGLSVAVVHDQEMVWARGFGWSDVAAEVPATPQTLYRIGSITKLFTATAILQLRDAGKLRLDEPVATYLPWFRISGAPEGEPEITVLHLLTHTSGLPREGAFPYWTTHEFPSIEEIQEALPDQQATHPPATTYKYSNLGIALLGAIVTEVSGEPWVMYVDKHIFRPLGMTSTTAAPTEEHHRHRAISYMRRRPDGSRGIFGYYNTGGIAPAANIVSNVEDLARFARLQFRTQAQAGGEQILRGATLREMQRPHWVYDSWTGGRGLGFALSHEEGKTFVSHGGWVGGNRSQLLLEPGEKIGVLVMINADDGSPSFFAEKIYETLAPALAAASVPVAESRPQPDPVWERWVGLYQDPWEWQVRVLLLEGQLALYDYSYPPDEDPAAGLTPLEPLGGNRFRLPDGEVLTFELDGQGQVLRIQRRYEYLYPADR